VKPVQSWRQRTLSWSIYGLATLIGVLALIYPFLIPSLSGSVMGQAHADDAPLLLTILVGLCFIVLLLEVQGQAVNAKFIALLGILVSMNAVLRFLEIAIPGPGGFSPIFFLIVLTGYVYGARLGFLMGALTLLVSALITGGVGPWLPYQMLAASWIGLSAPVCGPLVRLVCRVLGRRYDPREKRVQRLEVVVLTIFAGLWGLVYGAILNVSFWPYAVGPAEQYWEPGIGVGDTLRRYVAFYVATSLAWDVLRAASNVLLSLTLGAPVLRALRRFQRRFAFQYQDRPPVQDGAARAKSPNLSR
jgi:energy-coupling factor transport system substrate-specific component